jgi:hypothetical protein
VRRLVLCCALALLGLAASLPASQAAADTVKTETSDDGTSIHAYTSSWSLRADTTAPNLSFRLTGRGSWKWSPERLFYYTPNDIQSDPAYSNPAYQNPGYSNPAYQEPAYTDPPQIDLTTFGWKQPTCANGADSLGRAFFACGFESTATFEVTGPPCPERPTPEDLLVCGPHRYPVAQFALRLYGDPPSPDPIVRFAMRVQKQSDQFLALREVMQTSWNADSNFADHAQVYEVGGRRDPPLYTSDTGPLIDGFANQGRRYLLYVSFATPAGPAAPPLIWGAD